MTDLDTTRTYSSHEAARLAGITYRQITYWCSLGILGDHLIGEGSGSRHRLTSADVLALSAVASYVRIIHGWNDDQRGSAGVQVVGPHIATAVRDTPDAAWLVVTPDRQVTAHRTLPDAVRAITLHGGLLVDLTADRGSAA